MEWLNCSLKLIREIWLKLSRCRYRTWFYLKLSLYTQLLAKCRRSHVTTTSGYGEEDKTLVLRAGFESRRRFSAVFTKWTRFLHRLHHLPGFRHRIQRSNSATAPVPYLYLNFYLRRWEKKGRMSPRCFTDVYQNKQGRPRPEERKQPTTRNATPRVPSPRSGRIMFIYIPLFRRTEACCAVFAAPFRPSRGPGASNGPNRRSVLLQDRKFQRQMCLGCWASAKIRRRNDNSKIWWKYQHENKRYQHQKEQNPETVRKRVKYVRNVPEHRVVTIIKILKNVDTTPLEFEQFEKICIQNASHLQLKQIPLIKNIDLLLNTQKIQGSRSHSPFQRVLVTPL